nr:hypothetical protein [Comamonas testosteroni]
MVRGLRHPDIRTSRPAATHKLLIAAISWLSGLWQWLSTAGPSPSFEAGLPDPLHPAESLNFVMKNKKFNKNNALTIIEFF